MDRDAPCCSSNVSHTDELSQHPCDSSQNSAVKLRHRRHASNVSTAAAAARTRPPAVTPQRHDRRETSPHSSASAPLHDAHSPRPNAHMRRLSGISKTFSFPNLHTQPETEDRPSSSPSAQPPSTPLIRANTAPSIPRLSPSQKRKPPASHSSYGIETSNGPPPSYSTQQTLSQDRGWTQERGRQQKPVAAPLTGSSTLNTGSYRSYTQPAGSKDAQGPDSRPLHVTYKNKHSNSAASPKPPSNHVSHASTNFNDTSLATQARATCTTTLPESTSASRSPTFHTPPLEQLPEGSSPEPTDHSTIETPKISDLTPPTSASTNNMQDDYDTRPTGLEPKSYDSLQHSSSEDNFQAVSPAKSADLFLKIARDSATTQPNDASFKGHDRADEAQNTDPAKPPNFFRTTGNLSSVNEASSTDSANGTDLFLKIARDSATARHDASAKESTMNTTSRKSRISLPFLTSSRPTTSIKSSPVSAHLESETARLPQRLGKRSSLGPHVPGALTSSTYNSDTRSRVGVPADQSSNVDPHDSRSQTRSRRHSNANPETSRPPTRSYQTRSRLASENLFADRFRMQEHTKTESTISTTAPSTVWDELDDLKSRIKKLELTGKIPSSSAAAMNSSNDRPRTATTQATTLSSSPKHKSTGPTNNIPSAVEGIPSTVHPTLHEALINAKSSVSNEVYQKLQATAQVALQLSTMMTHDYSGTSTVTPQSERQIRRRTESMCRSLTELTIALLADQNAANSPASRPGSRDAFSSSQIRSRRRSDSNERPPVITSRIVSRRTSLANSTEPSPRPVSRAMTEAPSAYRQSTASRANFSREYTRQHPLPVNDNSKSTTPQGNLLSRRSAAVNTPPTASSPAVESSPVPFTISIERPGLSALPRPATFPDSPGSVVSEASPASRGGAGRRTLGFAARVSSVSSRLKAVREQRLASAAARGNESSGPPTVRTVVIPPAGSGNERV